MEMPELQIHHRMKMEIVTLLSRGDRKKKEKLLVARKAARKKMSDNTHDL